MELIDSHCHLDFPEFDADRADVLDHCDALCISTIVVPGVDAATWDRVIGLCVTNQRLYPALGLHPMFMHRHGDGDLERLDRDLQQQAVVAVGEIGLDFYDAGADRSAQIRLLAAQLALAAAHGLPVLLHVRKAHDQVLALLSGSGVSGGIAHAFNGSLQQARRYIDLGFRLGFGGMLTFERSRKLRDLARQLPLDALVLETDAPDMTVASHRGQRNSPEYLPEVAAAMGAVRGVGVAAIASATSHNVRQVLGLPA